MSYLGILLSATFAANVLLVHGLGICPALRNGREQPVIHLVAYATVSFCAVILLWTLRELVLIPLNLARLDGLFFIIFIAPALKSLARLATNASLPAIARVAAIAEESILSCLVFGLVLISVRSNWGFREALVSALASVLGYWLAIVLLDAIRERLELTDLPASMKGAPALLLSAGLIGMAFWGLDSVFVHNLVG